MCAYACLSGERVIKLFPRDHAGCMSYNAYSACVCVRPSRALLGFEIQSTDVSPCTVQLQETYSYVHQSNSMTTEPP